MRSFSGNEADNLKSNQIQCIRSIFGILKKQLLRLLKWHHDLKRFFFLFISHLTCQEIMLLFKLCCLCPFYLLQHQFRCSCG